MRSPFWNTISTGEILGSHSIKNWTLQPKWHWHPFILVSKDIILKECWLWTVCKKEEHTVTSKTVGRDMLSGNTLLSEKFMKVPLLRTFPGFSWVGALPQGLGGWPTLYPTCRGREQKCQWWCQAWVQVVYRRTERHLDGQSPWAMPPRAGSSTHILSALAILVFFR